MFESHKIRWDPTKFNGRLNMPAVSSVSKQNHHYNSSNTHFRILHQQLLVY